MTDYEYLFATSLHQKLREKIVGKIFVKVTQKDELFVKIESYGGLEYRFYRSNFSESLLNGYTTDFAAYEVVIEFKKFITNKYFV